MPRNSVDVHVGARVRAVRQQRDISVAELADYLGISEVTVRRFESGESRIGAVQLFKISELLGVPIGTFFDDGPPQVGPRH